MSLAPVAKQQFFGNDGNVLSGGFLYTYEAGNPTPLATYSESTLTIPNSNPIVLDSAGRAPAIYLLPVSYKFVLKTALFVTVWTQDNILNSEDLILSTLASTATAAGDSLIGYKGIGSGATARTLHDRMQDFSVSAFDHMTAAQIADVRANTALVDVTAAVLAADTAAGTTGTLYIPKGTYLIDDLTLVSHVVCDGVFSINTGEVLTFSGTFDGSFGQHFTGAGLPLFGVGSITAIYPEWFGAKSDGVTDSTAAINKCRLAVPTTSAVTIAFAAGTYLANISLTDRDYYYGLKFKGQGARITYLKPYTNNPVISIGATAFTITHISFEGFRINNTGTGFANVGILLSGLGINDLHSFKDIVIDGGFLNGIKSTGRLIGVTFKNVRVESCTGSGIYIETPAAGASVVNHNRFENVHSLWNAVDGIYLEDLSGNGFFTQVFEQCNWEANTRHGMYIVGGTGGMTGGGGLYNSYIEGNGDAGLKATGALLQFNINGNLIWGSLGTNEVDIAITAHYGTIHGNRIGGILKLRNTGSVSKVNVASNYGTTFDYDATGSTENGVVLADAKLKYASADSPNVTGVTVLVFTNAGAINLTTLVGGMAGQMLTIHETSATGVITVTHSASLVLKASANVDIAQNQSMTFIMSTDGVWREVARNN
jgi:hypothetical protein